MIISNVGKSYVVHPESIGAESGQVSASFMNGAINWKTSGGFSITLSGDLGSKCGTGENLAQFDGGIYQANIPAYYSSKICTAQLRDLGLSDEEIANVTLTSFIRGYSKLFDDLLLTGNNDLVGILDQTVGYVKDADFSAATTGADVLSVITDLITNAPNLNYNTGTSVMIYISSDLFMKLKGTLLTTAGGANSFVVVDTILSLNDSQLSGGGSMQFKVKPIASDTPFIMIANDGNFIPILDSFNAEAIPVKGENTLNVIVGGAASYIMINPDQIVIAK